MTTTKTMRVYLAGPMTGYKENNFPAFARAAEALRNLGLDVVSPAEMDLANGFDPTKGLEEQGFSRAEVLLKDLEIIGRGGIEGIVFLPGSRFSPGAKTEYAFGKYLGLRMFKYVPRQAGGWMTEMDQSEAELYFAGWM